MHPWVPFGKWLIGLGVLLVVLGLALLFSSKIPFLGRLPGDILIQRDRVTCYFPIVTSLILSLVLSLLLWFFGRRG